MAAANKPSPTQLRRSMRLRSRSLPKEILKTDIANEQEFIQPKKFKLSDDVLNRMSIKVDLEDDNQLSVVLPLEDENNESWKVLSLDKPDSLSVELCSIHGDAKIISALDSDVIDRYIKQIWEKLPKHKQESCTYLDCLWFKMYLEEALSMKILKWTKAKRIFSKQYVFIPIIHWGHWNLLILCHFGEKMHSQTRRPYMLLLDSLRKTGPIRLEPLIRKFLTDLYKEEGKKDVEKTVPNIPLFIPEVPQQSNGNDCGIFLLHFIDMFLQSASELDISDGNYPCFLAENWFESSDIEQRRKHIYDLLLNDNNCANQIINRRVSTRIKKLSGFVSIQQKSNLIDLSL